MANPTIVLIHGAFADASGFRGLYDQLLGEDVTVVAPPNPLRGLTGGDGEYLKAVIGEIDGPVLLVGHSYGGSVITAAGTAGNVVALVRSETGDVDEADDVAGRAGRRDDRTAVGMTHQQDRPVDLPDHGFEVLTVAAG